MESVRCIKVQSNSCILICSSMMASYYGRNTFRGLYWPATVKRHLKSPLGEQPEMDEVCGLTLLSQSNFPWSLWPFCNRLVVETTNLICWLIGFQGIWDPCCYYVLLLRPQEPSLARSRKFQEHIQEWGGVLAPGMSLRLEVAACLLAACLWGQWPESIPLSWLCPWSMWIEALLVTMRFVRTQISNSRI